METLMIYRLKVKSKDANKLLEMMDQCNIGVCEIWTDDIIEIISNPTYEGYAQLLEIYMEYKDILIDLWWLDIRTCDLNKSGVNAVTKWHSAKKEFELE